MTALLLDTSVWVALAKGEPVSASLERRLDAATGILPAVVHAELVSLAEQGRIAPHVPDLALENAVFEPIGEEDAREGGRLHGRARSGRSNLSLPDALIVAAARRLRARVLTLDRALAEQEGVELLR